MSGGGFFPTSGGGGASTFDATVGATGADYTTIKAAIDAGKYRLLVIDNTTETADVAFGDNDTYIFVQENAIVDMVTYKFTDSAAHKHTFTGDMGEITFSYSTSTTLTDFTDGGSLILEGVYFDNNSTAGVSNVYKSTTTPLDYVYINNCRFDVPNVALQDNITIGNPLTNKGNFMSNCSFYGEGSNSRLFTVNADGIASNIRVYGGISTLSGITLSGQLNGLNIYDTNAGGLIFVTGGSVTENIYVHGSSSDVNISVQGTMSLSNVDIGDGSIDMGNNDSCNINNIYCDTIDMSDGGMYDNRFSNIYLSGKIQHLGGRFNYFSNLRVQGTAYLNGKENSFSNCSFNGAVSLGSTGDRIRFNNCSFLSSSGITIPSGADGIGFNNCQVGTDGGGATTITVASGSNKTRIIGCTATAAISDAGTGTVDLGNTEF